MNICNICAWESGKCYIQLILTPLRNTICFVGVREFMCDVNSFPHQETPILD